MCSHKLYPTDEAVRMPFGVQCCHTDLVDNRLITGPTVGREQLYIARPAIGFVFVFMISFGIVAELFVAVLAEKVFGMPCLAHRGKTFLH